MHNVRQFNFEYYTNIESFFFIPLIIWNLCTYGCSILRAKKKKPRIRAKEMDEDDIYGVSQAEPFLHVLSHSCAQARGGQSMPKVYSI